MKTTNTNLAEDEKELVMRIIADSQSMDDIQSKLKRLFAGNVEVMLEVGMDEHLPIDIGSSKPCDN